jgi:cation diffusion facilitator family transporter
MKHEDAAALAGHSHIFLAAGHAANERRIWAAIWLTFFMMAVEIAGGTMFGSLAVVADGFHMATHALAFLLAALAYTYARWHAGDPRFGWGTGKLGDLAGFASAIILAMIALGIGFDAAVRLFSPVTIHFDEAIFIAAGGLGVNVATAWLLSGGGGHRHGHDHDEAIAGHSMQGAHAHEAMEYGADTADHVHRGARRANAAVRDHNIRAASMHVTADAAISILAICGLLLGRFFGLAFMDPVMGLAGALVIASWAFGLIRDTSGVLLDMTPDEVMAAELRRVIESDGDRVADFHLWRLGPGHLGAIFSVVTAKPRDADFYRARLSQFKMLSHVTVEVRRARPLKSAGGSSWRPWFTR